MDNSSALDKEYKTEPIIKKYYPIERVNVEEIKQKMENNGEDLSIEQIASTILKKNGPYQRLGKKIDKALKNIERTQPNLDASEKIQLAIKTAMVKDL